MPQPLYGVAPEMIEDLPELEEGDGEEGTEPEGSGELPEDELEATE